MTHHGIQKDFTYRNVSLSHGTAESLEDGMTVKGFRIFATKEDALKIAQNERNFTYVTITDVKSSIYKKR